MGREEVVIYLNTLKPPRRLNITDFKMMSTFVAVKTGEIRDWQEFQNALANRNMRGLGHNIFRNFLESLIVHYNIIEVRKNSQFILYA